MLTGRMNSFLPIVISISAVLKSTLLLAALCSAHYLLVAFEVLILSGGLQVYIALARLDKYFIEVK
jgi:hypothetical protein